MHAIAPAIIPIHLPFVNAYLVRGERWIIVDSGAPGDAPAILKVAAQHGIEPTQIGLILLTHGHVDHFGSAADLRAATGAPIAVHVADSDMLRTGRNPSLISYGIEARMIRPFLPWATKPVVPDRTFDSDFDLTKYGIDGKIVPTPGHSPGSITLVLSDGSAFTGDLVRGGYLGGRVRANLPNPAYFVDNIDQMRISLTMVLSLPVERLFVGHGGTLAPKDVANRLPQLYPAAAVLS
jgi:hydroxyacylglutathione hydrolase